MDRHEREFAVMLYNHNLRAMTWMARKMESEWRWIFANNTSVNVMTDLEKIWFWRERFNTLREVQEQMAQQLDEAIQEGARISFELSEDCGFRYARVD